MEGVSGVPTGITSFVSIWMCTQSYSQYINLNKVQHWARMTWLYGSRCFQIFQICFELKDPSIFFRIFFHCQLHTFFSKKEEASWPPHNKFLLNSSGPYSISYHRVTFKNLKSQWFKISLFHFVNFIGQILFTRMIWES